MPQSHNLGTIYKCASTKTALFFFQFGAKYTIFRMTIEKSLLDVTRDLGQIILYNIIYLTGIIVKVSKVGIFTLLITHRLVYYTQ